MLSVDQALSLVEAEVTPLPPVRVKLADAGGLVLASDVVSNVNSPPYDKAQMDGYALVSADQEPQRRVIGRVAAGEVPRHAITPGTALRIMTGAPLPDGADAVVPLEQVDEIDDQTIRVNCEQVPSGWHIMHLGDSIRADQVVLQKGHRIRPIDCGIIADVGHVIVEVVPTPRVAVLPTGNELVPIGQTVSPGQIRNSNGPLLCSAAAKLGADVVDLGIGPDDLASLKALIEQGLESDILLLSGGVSAGDFDLVPGVLSEVGVKNIFHRIALRPGRPLWFGVFEHKSRRTLVLGLPGNPVSSYACFELFARPALNALAGRGFLGLPRQNAVLSSDYVHRGSRTTYLPAKLTEQPEPSAELLRWLSSGDLAALARANCLVEVPADSDELPAGQVVQVLRLE